MRWKARWKSVTKAFSLRAYATAQYEKALAVRIACGARRRPHSGAATGAGTQS